ncbi:MAG TPA: sugar phosphate isomerase/epimerase family protein [Bryobacteraceae bacterium]|nr:sugar phosphate isomerase/epimerase family protein [Bryobacteraceae bacterium]
MDRFRIGLNTYCLRAFRWLDRQLLDYAASLKLDAVFLQDSVDPGTNDPAHWREVREQAERLGLHLETGTGASLPRTPDGFRASVQLLREAVKRAAAMGSPIVRTLVASDREHLPPGPPAQHIETMIRLLRAVRSEAMDAGVKFAIENHKDLLCWETRQLIEGAGKEFVGSYLDTGNPVFVFEDPMETVETLGPLALTFHLRDSVVYEARGGIAVQWVPLGEGVVDFRKIVARAKELCPNVYVYIKPITGRPPVVRPYLDPQFMKTFGDLNASTLARFLALAKQGHPYEGEMVIEDVGGRANIESYAAALRYQQKDHMERSVEYGKKALDLGLKWRA